jgi:hypothetical protein
MKGGIFISERKIYSNELKLEIQTTISCKFYIDKNDVPTADH